jgi:hypothetical protein
VSSGAKESAGDSKIATSKRTTAQRRFISERNSKQLKAGKKPGLVVWAELRRLTPKRAWVPIPPYTGWM